jgi:FRG domain-containing protein
MPLSIAQLYHNSMLHYTSIDLFRATARSFAAAGEQNALTDDFVALMVLRHYSVKTRLLDWSGSPYVAAYFAVHDQDTQDGALWSFDRVRYEEMGKEQWQRWPETTTDRSGDPSKFAAGLTAFITDDSPPDWVIAAFYPVGFPRQELSLGPTQSLHDLAATARTHCRVC